MADTPATARSRPADPEVVLRTVWLFQALIAGPLAVGWVVSVGNELEYPGTDAYPACRCMFLAIFAAAVLGAVIVQWRLAVAAPQQQPDPKATARFELAKAALATAVWLWLLLDAVFYIPKYPYYYDPYLRRRAVRIVVCAVSFAVPCLFFYPTAFWSARLARKAGEHEGAAAAEDGAEASENTPLLRGG